MSDNTEGGAAKSAKKMKMSMQTMVMAALLVVALGAAAFFWNESRQANSDSAEAIAARNAEESEEVITSLDAILLTESETEPTVARVEEPQLLRDANPDFYKNVEAGDHLILYPQRAIIYRSAEKRIINIAPIIDTSQLDTSGTDASSDESTN